MSGTHLFAVVSSRVIARAVLCVAETRGCGDGRTLKKNLKAKKTTPIYARIIIIILDAIALRATRVYYYFIIIIYYMGIHRRGTRIA